MDILLTALRMLRGRMLLNIHARPFDLEIQPKMLLLSTASSRTIHCFLLRSRHWFLRLQTTSGTGCWEHIWFKWVIHSQRKTIIILLLIYELKKTRLLRRIMKPDCWLLRSSILPKLRRTFMPPFWWYSLSVQKPHLEGKILWKLFLSTWREHH